MKLSSHHIITLLALSPLECTAFGFIRQSQKNVLRTRNVETANNRHSLLSLESTTRKGINDQVQQITSSSSISTPEDRAMKAKQTWSTVALSQPKNKNIQISLEKDTTIYNQALFDEFCKIKGTYYINGLSTCQVGDRLVHPFEAHGHCHALTLYGNSNVQYTSHLVETPLTKKESEQNKVCARGVMSTVSDFDSIWGKVQNAVSSRERDTANLVANLWPLSGDSNIDPILIVCTDNGEPYALDPKTLKMKGRLVDVIPKLKSVFPNGSKCLAHARYDERKNRLIMCINTMDVPGEGFKGNATMEFVELDSNFDVAYRREHTTRFMVFHDWALTQNYYVVPKNPAYIKWPGIAKFMTGSTLGTNVFAMEEETNGEFILIPRHDTKKDVKEVPSDSFFNCFHFGPVFETDTDTMLINACVFDSYEFGGEMGFDGTTQSFNPIAWGTEEGISTGRAPAPKLDQFVIDMKSFEIKRKKRVPVIPTDMPNFNGDAKELKYSYFLGCERVEGWFPFRQIVKLNLDTYESSVWDAGDDKVVSEPMFIPRNSGVEEEDDGFVISFIHNADNKTSNLMIWDSKMFDEGPIAECPLGDLFPWCVHGSFYPDYIP